MTSEVSDSQLPALSKTLDKNSFKITANNLGKIIKALNVNQTYRVKLL